MDLPGIIDTSVTFESPEFPYHVGDVLPCQITGVQGVPDIDGMFRVLAVAPDGTVTFEEVQ